MKDLKNLSSHKSFIRTTLQNKSTKTRRKRKMSWCGRSAFKALSLCPAQLGKKEGNRTEKERGKGEGEREGRGGGGGRQRGRRGGGG